MMRRKQTGTMVQSIAVQELFANRKVKLKCMWYTVPSKFTQWWSNCVRKIIS